MLDGGWAGVSGLSRLDRDAVSQSGVRTVVLLEGINDINSGATADQVVAGLKQAAATLHAAGLRVLAGTLTPLAGCGCGTPERRANRDQVNTFIRANGGQFDAVVDFDAAVRDPANPQALLPGTTRATICTPTTPATRPWPTRSYCRNYDRPATAGDDRLLHRRH